jgi:hypothetical protein
MPHAHIRIARTPDVEQVLSFLRGKLNLLSDAEIIKLALSEKYHKEVEEQMEKEKKLRQAFHHAMEEGRKVGIRLMKEKGLDPDTVTEQEFYDLFLDTHKHNASHRR